MVKILEKSHAIKLREKGHSYQYIAKKIKVSKSTLSSWLSEIPYIPNEETIDRIGKARARAGQVKSQQKISSILNARGHQNARYCKGYKCRPKNYYVYHKVV